MPLHLITPPLDESSARKRVCKACDRCRLKKSKCDGTTPCSRCRSDNAICVFGERKKSHDKVYPKGYVEMLEQQQTQLVNGLHELYKRVTTGRGWEGQILNDSGNGRPLTHDILSHLGVLQLEKSSPSLGFEDDVDTLQQRLMGDGPESIHRRDSTDSEEEIKPGQTSQTSPIDIVPQSYFKKDIFTSPQLPTPPLPQSPYSSQTWQSNGKGTPVRPHSLQLNPIYHSSQTISMSGPSMNPTNMNVRAWLDSPMTYEDGNEYLRYNGLSNYNNLPTSQQQCSVPIEATMQNTAPNWNEDDFTAYLNNNIT